MAIITVIILQTGPQVFIAMVYYEAVGVEKVGEVRLHEVGEVRFHEMQVNIAYCSDVPEDIAR